MTSNKDRAIVVSALKHAAPYIRLFKGKVFVLKAGGEIFADAARTQAFMEQVGILHQVGIRVVMVHGGGPQSTALATALGLDTTFVDGRRVTDGASLDVATMVLNGQINTRVLAACRDLQIPAVGISGLDAGLIRAHRRPPVERKGESSIDYGFVGDIDSVDADVLVKQLDNGLMPVVSPLSCDESGTVLNINADTVAAAIAAELCCHILFCSAERLPHWSAISFIVHLVPFRFACKTLCQGPIFAVGEGRGAEGCRGRPARLEPTNITIITIIATITIIIIITIIMIATMTIIDTITMNQSVMV